jgi:hypothetical protein
MKLNSAGWGRGATDGTGSAAVDMGSTAAGTNSTTVDSAAVVAITGAAGAAGWGQGLDG